MTAELGRFTLILALSAAALATFTAAAAARSFKDGGGGAPALTILALRATRLQAVFAAAAFLALMLLFARSDYSVALVAAHGGVSLPLGYRLTAVWGNHEGSMLLWFLVLSLCGAVMSVGRVAPLRLYALSVQGSLGVGFALFMLLASDPFLRLWPPAASGAELNPLLQDVMLTLHPPILYSGYVGLSGAFSFAAAALVLGRSDGWARAARPWALFAWCALTAGIALGSGWAYYELGWGGFWFWDPVENASLTPWLTATALLHSLLVAERRGMLIGWATLLAVLAFCFSLAGAFLVRSGILTSVHAFANDPERGLWLLALLALYGGFALVLYGLRAPTLDRVGARFAPLSRESGLVVNNLLMLTLAAVVLIGTLYPLFLEALGLGRVAVGPPYFNLMALALAMPVAAAMATAPLLPWGTRGTRGARGSWGSWGSWGGAGGATGRAVAKALALPAVVSAGAAALAWWSAPPDAGLKAALLAAAASGVLTATLVAAAGATQRRTRPPAMRGGWRVLPAARVGGLLAHGGFAVLLAGIAGSTLWQTQSLQFQKIGETIDVAGHRVTLRSVSHSHEANYAVRRATFEVKEQGEEPFFLIPESRFYTLAEIATTEVAIHATLWGDLYVAFDQPSAPPEGAPPQSVWTTRVWYKPLALWIWAGAGLMACGGAVALAACLSRRRRSLAPVRARASQGSS